MKYIAISAIVMAITSATHIQSIKEDEVEELDELMNKYDEKDKKPSTSSGAASKGSDSSQPTQSMIQDMELKILSGNNQAETSQKSADDDMYNEVLDKYTTSSKKDENIKILTKENAQDACNEIVEKKGGIDGFAANDKVKVSFEKLWKEHDTQQKNYIDSTEGYNLLAEIVKE